MSTVTIQLVDRPSSRISVPWEEAPLGPAQVVSGISAVVKAGEIVIIVHLEDWQGIQNRRGALCPRCGANIVRPSSEVRVIPLGDCTLELTFD